MSVANWFQTRKRAFEQRTKAVASAYTVKVGSVANNLVSDRVITVTDPTANFTITLPNGTYPGQDVLISLVSNTNSKTVTVAATTGTGGDSTLDTAGQYMAVKWIDSTTGWVAVSESVAS